jgi:hypothetical protein
MRAKGRTPGQALKLTMPLRIRELDLPVETTADVRVLLRHLPEEYRALHTWQHVEREVWKAEKSGDAKSATVAVKIVLIMSNLLDWRPL